MTTVFARITEEHDCIAFDLVPCACLLYRFLLRSKPAGEILEFELVDFQNWTGKNRPKPYGMKWIKKGLAQLRKKGLVEIVKRYSSKCFKLITYHPKDRPSNSENKNSNSENKNSNSENKNSNSENKNSNFGNKNSKKEGSKPHHAVPSYREHRELREQQTQPTAHPVVVENKILEKPIILKKESSDLGSDRQGVCEEQKPETINLSESKTDRSEPISAPAETEPKNEINLKADDQLDQIDELGVRLNPVLAKLVKMTSSEIVNDAIEAYKEYKHQKNVKNPTGCMVKAIKQQWQPNQKSAHQSLPPEFLTWYPTAVAAGKVMNVPINYLSSDRYNEPMVQIPSPSPFAPYTLVSWREVYEEH